MKYMDFLQLVGFHPNKENELDRSFNHNKYGIHAVYECMYVCMYE